VTRYSRKIRNGGIIIEKTKKKKQKMKKTMKKTKKKTKKKKRKKKIEEEEKTNSCHRGTFSTPIAQAMTTTN
jgi:mannitol-specific phosphotransferase system IIBC component